MGKKKENKEAGEESRLERTDRATTESVPDVRDSQYLEVRVNKSENELVIKDPKTGMMITAAAKVTEENDDEEITPLTPDEFRTALERVSDLGLTWTADRVPHVTPKESGSDEVLLSEEFERIQRDYPHLPLEMSSIIFHILTGTEASALVVGSQDDLEQKAAILDKQLITPAYKSEFFFKHATKVPYLTDIDWEVVFKLEEKNVKHMPGISYALLSLSFLDPSRRGSHQHERTVTVAVDVELAERLSNALNQVKNALERARALTEDIMKKQVALREKDNASHTGGNTAESE